MTTITRVQGQATVSTTNVTSLAGTLPSGVTQGNLLVASVSSNNSNTVTAPSGWSQAVFNQPNSPDNMETGLWYLVVDAGHAGQTSWTWTFGTAHNAYICIEEWSATNGWQASPVDQTAVGETAATPTTGTTIVSGTTSTTTQATELWVASLAYSSGAQSESSITSGWTKDLETTDSGNHHTVTLLYQTVSSTGAAACQYTIGTAEFWAGCVATFLPVTVTTNSRTVPATAALQSTISRTIPAAAALQSTNPRTVPATAALKSTNSRTITATAALANTLSRTIPATAALAITTSRTIPATAALQATNSRTITATAALTVTNSRTIPATAALAQSAVFYASNVAQTQGGLTQSDQMSEVSGGTETSYTVTMPSSGTNSYVELLSQGGASSGTSSLPSPTGNGWSINLTGNTILAGSWSFAFTLKKSGTSMTGASLYVRAYRRTVDGTYYPISSSALTAQTYSTTKTVYTLPSNLATLWQFISGDTLYMDAFVLNPTTAWTSDVFTVYVSNSAALGVYNDGIIISPQLITTPAELACYIGTSALQTGTTLPVRDQSFTLADALDQRSILTLTGEDSAGTLSYQRGMPVMFSDHDQGKLYDGYVSSDKISKPSAGGAAQLEHALTFMDHHYDVDKRANTTNYLNWSAGDMTCDFIQQTLSQENITGAFALESDYTPATFGQGTLTGTVATTTTTPFTYAPNTASPPITSNTGDLELTRAGTQFTLTESVTSDFSGGTLTNMAASNNTLAPTTVSALKVVGQFTSGFANIEQANTTTESVSNSASIKIWSGSMIIGSNDTLNYDLWISSTSPAFMAGVDFLCNDGTTLTAQIGTVGTNNASGLFDSNNFSVDALTDLADRAKDCWYTRTIKLTGLNGKTINAVSIFLAGSSAGTYTAFIKNCYLGSQSGSPFFGTTATSPNVNPPVVSTIGGYVASTVITSVVSVYDPLTSSRISPAHSISGVGLVQNSTITWTAALPSPGGAPATYPPGVTAASSSTGTAPSMLMMLSYDNNTWLLCTNQNALPGLPPGANVSGLSFYLREQFSAGSDPSAIPQLLQVSVTINSAAAQTTTDVVATYGQASDWNGGTEAGAAPNSNGDLTLVSQTRNWSDGLITNQTLFPPSAGFGGLTESASTHADVISYAANNAGSRWAQSRYDFVPPFANGTIECDVMWNSSNTTSNISGETGIEYRQTGWSYPNNTGAYFAAILVYGNGSFPFIVFGYGPNQTGATTDGTFTTLASVSVATINLNTYYHLKVVFNGPHHQIYFNNASTPQIDMLDYTYLSAGSIGLRGYTSSSVNSNVSHGLDNLKVTPASVGTWTSPSLSLSALGTVGYNQICWQEQNPTGATQSTAIVQASLDGGSTWQSCTNGAEIPQLATRGTSVSGKSLVLQVILASGTNLATPVIWGLYVRVCGPYGTVSGTRISPALSLSPVGYVASSNCMWNANIPTNTSLTVQTTQDLSTYHTVGSSGAGEALPYWTNQPAATQDLFGTNTSANYTNTSKSGGSASTVTYDTTNSRVTLSGGSGGLYLGTAAGTMTDMDMLVDMDESDAGGMVWREVSTSNYYELGVYDASSSGGFTNQLRLYKVSSGTRSLLGSASSITFTRGTFHGIRVTMQGGLINVYWDGTCVQSYLDTSPLASGPCGLRNDGGTSRYYQLWMQSLGTNLSGQVLYTKVTMTTSDPSVMPQLFTLVACVRGPSIGTGATIAQLHPVTTPFATYYSSEMDTMVQASGDYYWYVDKWRQMHFGARLARPGAFPVQSIYDTANASGYLLYQPQVTVLSAADLFRSQQIVTEVTALITPPTEIKVADGSTTSWTMGYPVYSAPTITTNGQGATVGVQGIDNNRQFYWQPGSTGISYDSSLPKLPAGTVLAFTYVGESTVNTVLNNSASQAAQATLELNSGIVAEIESATNASGKGMTTAQATTFGNGLLARYGSNGTIELIGTTLYPGLAPGTVIPLFLPEMMATWNAQLPIVKLTTTAYQGQNGLIYLYSIDATNGPNLSNWSRVWFGGGKL